MQGGRKERRKVEELSPYLLWEVLKNSEINFPASIVKVKGIYEGLSTEKEYNGFYFGRLKDENLSGSITLKIPASLLPYFENGKGKVFSVIGSPYLDIKPNFSKAEIVLTVKKIEGIAAPQSSSEINVLLSIKYRKGKINLKNYLMKLMEEGENPNVAIFLGETAIVDKDLLSSLGDKNAYYNLEFFRINLTSFDFIEKVKEIDEKGIYHLIAIIRGGGEGRELFDRIEIARELVSLNTPLCTAIGHAENVHLVDLIADETFITPTDFGYFLRNIAIDFERKYETKEKEEELLKELKRLMEENNKLKTEVIRLRGNEEKIRFRLEKELEKEFKKEIDKLKNSLILYKTLSIALLILLAIVWFFLKG